VAALPLAVLVPAVSACVTGRAVAVPQGGAGPVGSVYVTDRVEQGLSAVRGRLPKAVDSGMDPA